MVSNQAVETAASAKVKEPTEPLFEEDPTAGGSGDFSDSSCKDPSGGQIFINAASRPQMGTVQLEANNDRDREAANADSWISRAWKPVRRLFGKQPRASGLGEGDRRRTPGESQGTENKKRQDPAEVV